MTCPHSSKHCGFYNRCAFTEEKDKAAICLNYWRKVGKCDPKCSGCKHHDTHACRFDCPRVLSAMPEVKPLLVKLVDPNNVPKLDYRTLIPSYAKKAVDITTKQEQTA